MLKKQILTIKGICGRFSDDELIEKLLDFKPKGYVVTAVTPVSFEFIYYNPLDWIRGRRFKFKNVFADYFVTRGVSTEKSIINNDEVNVSVNSYNPTSIPFGFPSQSVMDHEFRHSLNRSMGLSEPKSLKYIKDYKDKEDLILKIEHQAINFLKAKLADELSGYLDDGSFQIKVRLLTFKIMSYDFDKMPEDYWIYIKEEYGFCYEEINNMKRQISDMIDVSGSLKKAYKAVSILEKKGYSRSWAVSYLCSKDNFLSDWVKAAEICPEALL